LHNSTVMKKNVPLFLFCLLLGSFIDAQKLPAAIQWQKCLGGSKLEFSSRIVRSVDGGYLLACETLSNDGDVIAHTGSGNVWVVKFSNTGVIQWQRCFAINQSPLIANYGVLDLKNTPDGGYIIATTTLSNDSSFTGYHSKSDGLIVKLSGDGTPQWQKCYGGSQIDMASAIQSTSDGGYIFLGSTSSTDGDITGNHGSYDVWVVKINGLGIIQWQKCFGGTGVDISERGVNKGGSIIETSDKGFVFIANTQSSDGDVTGYHSGSSMDDAWIVKLDSAGNKLWQKCLGGSSTENGNDIIQLPNGNLVAVASAKSRDGDVIGNHGTGDIWVLTLDGQANLLWQRCLGGFADEYPAKIELTPDGNLLIGGAAASTDGDVIRPALGLAPDCWLVKLNTSGSILWQKTFGGSNWDEISDFSITDDEEIIFTAYLQSGNDGDVIGSHISTSDNHATGDVWIVKTGNSNTIKGSVFIDLDNNGIKDGNDPWVKSALIKSEKPGFGWESAVTNGTFTNKVDTGTFVSTVILPTPYYSVLPVSKQSFFASFFNTDSISFYLVPIPGKRDYRVNMVPITPARPGFLAGYKINYENAGTDTLTNKSVQLIKDHRSSFYQSSPVPSSISGDTLRWKLAALLPTDTTSISITFLNSSHNNRDTLQFLASIDTTGDLVPSDNLSLLRQRVTGSYDPNDKQESAAGFITARDIASDKRLVYTIRFQNTGNDTAFNITVKDTLDAKTDWNSIEMIGASHPYHLNIKEGNKLSWSFANIKLVDSVRNEPTSHGYIVYSIKPKPALQTGDSISNSASIYFDFNPGVKTNTAITRMVSVPLPPHPDIAGQRTSYCANRGLQEIKINNLPAFGSDITASAKLDGVNQTIAADSTISFNVSAIGTGTHQLLILFSNGIVNDSLKITFNITAAATPDVNLSSNITTVTNLTDLVTITATNAAGGGTAPKYTFAKDKAISTILQAESSSNTFTMQPNTLTVGSNWMYVRMKTSDSCFTTQTNIDSIDIERSAVTGLTDIDFPGQLINVYPNPFNNVININGLNAAKTYTVIIANAPGQKVYNRQIANSNTLSINNGHLQAGRYWLSIYDVKKHSLLGTIPLIKE
jgi:hypothetical protein